MLILKIFRRVKTDFTDFGISESGSSFDPFYKIRPYSNSIFSIENSSQSKYFFTKFTQSTRKRLIASCSALVVNSSYIYGKTFSPIRLQGVKMTINKRFRLVPGDFVLIFSGFSGLG